MKFVTKAASIVLLAIITTVGGQSTIVPLSASTTAQVHKKKATESKKTALYTNYYKTAIDAVLKEDEGLNQPLSILAFDTSKMKYFTKEVQAQLFKELKKEYKVKCILADYDTLEKKGYLEHTNGDSIGYFKKGLLIEIEDLTKKGNRYTLNISKWRSGLGAFGYSKAVLKQKKGKWILTTSNAWIS